MVRERSFLLGATFSFELGGGRGIQLTLDMVRAPVLISQAGGLPPFMPQLPCASFSGG